jgi:rhodanese-related sulfurtransferase
MKTISLPFLLSMFLVFSACSREVQTAQSNAEAPAPNTAVAEAGNQTAVISEKLGPAEFAKKLAESPDAQLVDVRTPEEVANGYLEGMVNIDYASPDKVAQLKQLDPNKPVFVYCAAGGRSARAADILKANGFTEIYDLTGGMTRWRAEGMDFVKK